MPQILFRYRVAANFIRTKLSRWRSRGGSGCQRRSFADSRIALFEPAGKRFCDVPPTIRGQSMRSKQLGQGPGVAMKHVAMVAKFAVTAGVFWYVLRVFPLTELMDKLEATRFEFLAAGTAVLAL